MRLSARRLEDSVTNKTLEDLAQEFMKWLPRKLAIRYSFVPNSDLGSIFSANLIYVSDGKGKALETPCVMRVHMLVHLNPLLEGHDFGVERMIVTEEGLARGATRALENWCKQVEEQPGLIPWLEPIPFVGIIRLGEDIHLTRPAESPAFGFYHGIISRILVEYAERFRLGARLDVATAATYQSYVSLARRFASFAQASQQTLVVASLA